MLNFLATHYAFEQCSKNLPISYAQYYAHDYCNYATVCI